jgi:hypothetical protein
MLRSFFCKKITSPNNNGIRMATKVGIISQVCILLGSRSVDNIQNGNPAFAAIGKIYDTQMPMMLSNHPWRFATKLFALNLVNETPSIPTWKYIFQMPGDWLRTWRTFPNTDYQIYGLQLYTNESSLTLEYTHKVDESLFPIYFENALVLRIASLGALTVTQNQGIKQAYERNFSNEIAIAKHIDSQNQPNVIPERDPLYASHFGDV